ALARDLEQACPLVVFERADELDVSLNPVQLHRLAVAVLAVGLMISRLSQAHLYGFEWPSFPPRVQSDRHRCAGTESGKQEIVGTRPGIRPTDSCRLVPRKPP